MWTVTAVCLVVITSVFGITELLRRFWLFLMRPKDDPPKGMLIFLKDDICFEQLHSATEYLAWEGKKQFFFISAIDCGLSEKNKKAVANLVNKSPDIIFGDKALIDCINSYKPIKNQK